VEGLIIIAGINSAISPSMVFWLYHGQGEMFTCLLDYNKINQSHTFQMFIYFICRICLYRHLPCSDPPTDHDPTRSPKGSAKDHILHAEGTSP
jgi:hypothetical protein